MPTERIASEQLLLRPLTGEDEREAWKAHHELAEDDFDFLLHVRTGEPWPAYLERLDRGNVNPNWPYRDGGKWPHLGRAR
jgi:hypothetical protein